MPQALQPECSPLDRSSTASVSGVPAVQCTTPPVRDGDVAAETRDFSCQTSPWLFNGACDAAELDGCCAGVIAAAMVPAPDAAAATAASAACAEPIDNIDGAIGLLEGRLSGVTGLESSGTGGHLPAIILTAPGCVRVDFFPGNLRSMENSANRGA